jgi:hypothetical protein
MAEINGRRVPLCEHCFTDGAVMRKYCNAPDLKFGHVESFDTVYQIADALAEKQGAKEH